MTTVVLDTSILIEIERSNQEMAARLSEIQEKFKPALDFAVTFVNHFEFYYGNLVKGSRHAAAAYDFLNQFDFLTATQFTSQLLSKIQHSLEKKGESAPILDLIVASLTIENNGILITRDRDFEKIPGLNYVLV